MLGLIMQVVSKTFGYSKIAALFFLRLYSTSAEGL